MSLYNLVSGDCCNADVSLLQYQEATIDDEEAEYEYEGEGEEVDGNASVVSDAPVDE